MPRRQDVLRASHDQPGEPDDGVQGRPQLVRHVGEEVRFVARGVLQAAVGLLQFPGSRLHLGLEVLSVPFDLFVEGGVWMAMAA